MKKHNKKKYKTVNIDADLDKELDGYDVESSDDGLDAEDRILIDNARGKKRKVEEEEVLPVHADSSSDEEDDEESYADEEEEEVDELDGDEDAISGDEDKEQSDDELYGGGVSSSDDMDSDLEDKNDEDGLPDSKAWGSKRKNYYHTDYVDKDYLGFDDEEAALTEEQEAKAIQERLLTQIDDADFTMGLLNKVEEKKEEALTKNIKLVIEKKVEIDRSKLNEVELKEFDERETPGFNKLLQDVKRYEEYSQLVLTPLIKLYEASDDKNLDGIKFLRLKYYTIWRFSLNFIFLLHLKARRTPNLDRHPIMRRLNEINELLKKLDALEKTTDLRESMLRILVAHAKSMTVTLTKKEEEENVDMKGKNRKERRKMLQLLSKRKEMEEAKIKENIKKIKFADEFGMSLEESAKLAEEIGDEDQMEESDGDNDEEADDDGTVKRPASYQILKNKGLTPRRKKEMRNPRVRNKNKYKKAVVRRKGQVKLARKEVQKYDGEISGIKKNLSRSVKLK